MLRAIATFTVAAFATATATDVPTYNVPAVDFTQLFSSTHELMNALQRDGIVALKNIPDYATLRTRYLATAAACAVHGQQHGAEFLLHRVLRDGTQRYTISSDSGRHLGESGFETVETCPQYQPVYHSFSRVVEHAVASVGRAIDASKAMQISRRQLYKADEARMSAHELLADSVHLDHFHAYESSRTLAEKSIEELSLEMHTDNGLLIAMAAPEYFDVQASGEVSARHTRSEDAGLLIKTAAGQVVRPLLKADELILMLGEGINTWIHTTPRLHAVTHGMQFPRGLSYADDSHMALRAWFGKMILLSEDHVMANTGLTYGEYANQTTRYLKDAANDQGFAAVACSPHRNLQASDSSCLVRTCSAKPGVDVSAMAFSCQITCNHQADDDKALCAQNCDCEDNTESGNKCWMLCVPLVPTDQCAGEQKCNSAYKKEDIAMVCAAGGGSNSTTTTPTPTPTNTTQAPKPATVKPAGDSSSSGSKASQSNSKSASSLDEDDHSDSGSGSLGHADVGSKTPKPSKSADVSTVGSIAAVAVAIIATVAM